MFLKIKTSARDTRHKHELKRIGQELLQLISRNDAESQTKALKIIETHACDDEVINARRFYQSTPLILACESGKTAIAEKLLAAKCIDVNREGRSKKNALEAALQAGEYDIALLLAADTRVNINATGACGFHPIFIAMKETSDCPFIVSKTLLSRPDIDLTKTYRLYVETTSEYRHYSHNMLHSLIRELRKIKSNESKATRFHDSEEAERQKQNYQAGLELLAQMIASRKIDINTYAIESESFYKTRITTPLMMAAMLHLPDVVTLLIAAGANPDLENEQKLTAHNIARIHSFNEQYSADERRVADHILEMLLEYMSRRHPIPAAVSTTRNLQSNAIQSLIADVKLDPFTAAVVEAFEERSLGKVKQLPQTETSLASNMQLKREAIEDLIKDVRLDPATAAVVEAVDDPLSAQRDAEFFRELNKTRRI